MDVLNSPCPSTNPGTSPKQSMIRPNKYHQYHSVSAPSTPFIQAKFLCGKYAAPADVMDALPSIVALLSKSRTKARTNVLFPQPLGPTIATFSPCRSKKLICLSTTWAKGRLKIQPILTPSRFCVSGRWTTHEIWVSKLSTQKGTSYTAATGPKRKKNSSLTVLRNPNKRRHSSQCLPKVPGMLQSVGFVLMLRHMISKANTKIFNVQKNWSLCFLVFPQIIQISGFCLKRCHVPPLLGWSDYIWQGKLENLFMGEKSGKLPNARGWSWMIYKSSWK